MSEENKSSFMSDLADFVIKSFNDLLKEYTEEIKASVEYSTLDSDEEETNVKKSDNGDLKFLWEAVRKVVLDVDDGGLSSKELGELFECTSIQEIIKSNTLDSFIDKIKYYEKRYTEKDRLKVGDEVVDHTGKNYIVCEVTEQSAKATNFRTYENYFDVYNIEARTGRRFPEIGGLIKKLRDYQK